MSSLVYFKFKANVKTDSIPFDGSSISVKDLKTGIRAKCRLHSTDFDLKLEDTTGKTYTKDDELIPKYTSIIVCRVPRITGEVHKKKINAAEEVPWRDLQRNVIANAEAQHASKNFVNNRRVLKPKQASSVVATQMKVEMPQDAPAKKEEELTEDTKADAIDTSPVPPKPPTPKDSSPSPPKSVDSKLDAKVTDVTTKPTIVSPNTCATVVATAPCATLVSSTRQPLLAAAITNSPTSTQLSCHSYASSASVMPNMISGITTGNNPLLNAICGMQLDSLRPHVVAQQSILPAQFQGSMVGGADWSAGSVLATSVAHGATLVDSVLQASNNQAAFGLVPAQGIPGVLPMTVPAPIQTIDGHKVLSKEEFYRLKMEMLHSSRRRHRRRHSRSRSPAQSYHRSSRHSDHRYSRHERSSRDRHRERRSPMAYEYGRRTENDRILEARREPGRLTRHPGLNSHVDLGSPYEQLYHRDDRRYVRELHGKPRSDPRYMVSRKEGWCMEPSTASISPPHRDLRERLRRVREPHALEQYTVSNSSRSGSSRAENESADLPIVVDGFEQPVFINDPVEVDQTASDLIEIEKKKHKKHKKHKDKKKKKHTRDCEIEQQC